MEGKVVIGIDIGGTSTKLALVGPDGSILGRNAFDTQACRTADAFVAELSRAIEHLYATVAAHYALQGIGIGTAGCDEVNGLITGAVNLPFRETLPIKQLIEERFHLPTRLVKDANSAVLGEAQFGAARGKKNIVLLTLGTGLGSGILVNGRVLTGSHGLASEFGHTLVDLRGRHCNCGQRGCLETYVSAPGIKRTVFELLADYPVPSKLREISFRNLSSTDITAAAHSGDFIAQEAYRRTGEWLGAKLADLVLLFDPEAIYLAGGLAQAGGLLLEPTRQALHQRLIAMFQGKTDVYLSALGSEDAALLGAASLIWQLSPTESSINP